MARSHGLFHHRLDLAGAHFLVRDDSLRHDRHHHPVVQPHVRNRLGDEEEQEMRPREEEGEAEEEGEEGTIGSMILLFNGNVTFKFISI